MTYSRNRAVVLAIVNGGMSIKDASTYFGIRTRWVRTLLQRFRTGGLEALQPRSTRPLTNPNKTPEHIRETIVELRHPTGKRNRILSHAVHHQKSANEA
ncbi:helix-turn-helix domain-containing protein [Brevibacterium sp. ACRRH]|uniref:helix-turn-helix domain-containing protein n=1 Tax=Brevibacterium sp. ACRRH TaxID=2918183 RepID=UPI0023B84079|nr:helix-turn-helix domain-containing protein [Brevibacterium sp. ACRRH]